MSKDTSIVILDGGRRTPRADILVDNKSPGLFSRYSTTQLGGFSIAGTLANTQIDPALIGHVVMGMAQHSHRDSIYGAQGHALARRARSRCARAHRRPHLRQRR
ncbi:MAG: hypothetical protein IPO67_28215 [Deltaproteobacteria bacterium]|nr:hypothetical protein [Deltaproteobacteria bacterium]